MTNKEILDLIVEKVGIPTLNKKFDHKKYNSFCDEDKKQLDTLAKYFSYEVIKRMNDIDLSNVHTKYKRQYLLEKTIENLKECI